MSQEKLYDLRVDAENEKERIEALFIKVTGEKSGNGKVIEGALDALPLSELFDLARISQEGLDIRGDSHQVEENGEWNESYLQYEINRITKYHFNEHFYTRPELAQNIHTKLVKALLEGGVDVKNDIATELQKPENASIKNRVVEALQTRAKSADNETKKMINKIIEKINPKDEKTLQQEAIKNKVDVLSKSNVKGIKNLSDLLLLANNYPKDKRGNIQAVFDEIAKRLLSINDQVINDIKMLETEFEGESQLRDSSLSVKMGVANALRNVSNDEQKINSIIKVFDPKSKVADEERSRFYHKTDNFLSSYKDDAGIYDTSKWVDINPNNEITQDDVNQYGRLSQSSKTAIATEWQAIKDVYQSRYESLLDNTKIRREEKGNQILELLDKLDDELLLTNDQKVNINQKIKAGAALTVSDFPKSVSKNIETDSADLQKLRKTLDKYNLYAKYENTLKPEKSEVNKEKDLSFHVAKLTKMGEKIIEVMPFNEAFYAGNREQSAETVLSRDRDPSAIAWLKAAAHTVYSAVEKLLTGESSVLDKTTGGDYIKHAAKDAISKLSSP